MIADQSWRDGALCASDQPAWDVFFASDTTAAKGICRGCPVRLDCLAAGLHEQHGVWGGLSERQRRRLRKLVAGGTSIEAALPLVDVDGRKNRSKATDGTAA